MSPYRFGPVPTRRLAVAILLALGGPGVASPASATTTTPGPASSAPDACALARPPAGRVQPAVTDVRLSVDRCGAAYYVEGRSPDLAPTPDEAWRRFAPLRDTFRLDSLPGSPRTLYLQFTGATVQGTAFNADYGLGPLTLPPFSITAPADTAFSTAELVQVQKAWQVVAEDFAPFDVDVTTRPPAPEALDRSGPADPTYGATVVVTRGGPLFDACVCGGLAYVGAFAATGASHAYYQPAVVFAGRSGDDIGEAISHEAGHLFGLLHDGAGDESYYEGRWPWAPIMGSSYGAPLSQWSLGEYPRATNRQDDVSVIAAGAPVRADDHGDTAATATPLSPGTTLDGLISTRTDVDAFAFTASGAVQVSVAPASMRTDLDAGLRILDAGGTTVATVDPPVRPLRGLQVSGLGATWSATLPPGTATWTAVVDGVGSGTPTTPGRYSDYGSLGPYRITFSRR